MNLFDDILNIPYNELDGGGLATVANSFLFTGTWWVPSSTNLWGIDPGDPTAHRDDRQLPAVRGFHRGVHQLRRRVRARPELRVRRIAGGRASGELLLRRLDLLPDDPAGRYYRQHRNSTGTSASSMPSSGKATDANGEPFGLFTNFYQVPICRT